MACDGNGNRQTLPTKPAFPTFSLLQPPPLTVGLSSEQYVR